jgi:hypothetical protein
MQQTNRARPGIALAAAVAVLALSAGAVVAHEVRQVGDYTIVIGFINEPVFVGQKSGLEILVTTGDEQPVEGLEKTLAAEAIQGEDSRQLTLGPRFGEPGWYQAFFFPTRAGAYTFHITGSIEGQEIDETFTSGPEGFSEVEEVSSAQFPVQLPAAAELADQAQRGADAAGLVPVALGLGAAGLVAGLAGLGLALGARRRAS